MSTGSICFCTFSQASLRYRSDIPNINVLRASEVAQAECFVRNVGFLSIDIETAVVTVESFTVEAITNTQFRVRATYNFQYDQPPTEILENFELWLMTRPAPENTTELQRTLVRIPVLTRRGNIEETIDIEEEVGNSSTEFQVYFQVNIIEYVSIV